MLYYEVLKIYQIRRSDRGVNFSKGYLTFEIYLAKSLNFILYE